MKTLLGSASRLYRTLNCPASHHLPQVKEPSEQALKAAERGSRLHKLLEEMNPDALSQDEFLKQFPPSDFVGLKATHRELALIYDTASDTVRVAGADRDYKIRQETDIPGTMDVVFQGFRTVEIWDYKFGEYPVKATQNNQLLHGALMMSKILPSATVFVLGIQQINSKGMRNDVWVCDKFTLGVFESKLKRAQEKARRIQKKLEVVPDKQKGWGYCRFCEARPVCPAWSNK